MKTRAQGLAWLKAQNGKFLDYDHQYGAQCFDFFNFYHQYITGKSPYAEGYGVPSAWQIFYIPTTHYIKIGNSNTLIPQAGDVVVYHNGVYGHVEVCLSHDSKGCTMIGENMFGNPARGVQEVYRTWSQINAMKIEGVMRPRWALPPMPAPVPPTGGTATVLRPVYVRTGPGTTYPLAGSKQLQPGNTFKYSRKVTGQKVSQNGVTTSTWYKSTLGHYVWAGNCRG